MTSPSMLTVREIAQDLQLSEQTVSQRLKAGTIPGGTKAFGNWRVDAKKYAAFKDEITNPRPAPAGTLAPRSARSEAARKGSRSR